MPVPFIYIGIAMQWLAHSIIYCYYCYCYYSKFLYHTQSIDSMKDNLRRLKTVLVINTPVMKKENYCFFSCKFIVLRENWEVPCSLLLVPVNERLKKRKTAKTNKTFKQAAIGRRKSQFEVKMLLFLDLNTRFNVLEIIWGAKFSYISMPVLCWRK